MLIYLKLLLTGFLWGGTFVAGRFLGQESEPYTSSFLRFFISSVVIVFLNFRNTGGLPRVCLRELLLICLLAFIGILLYGVCFFTGLETVPAGRAAVIVTTSPVCIAVLAAVIFKEELGKITFAGVLCSVSGAAVVISHGEIANIFFRVTRGELLIAGAMSCWVVYSLLGRYLLRAISPLAVTTWSFIAVIPPLFVLAWLEGLPDIIVRLGYTSWISLLFLSIPAGITAYTWYNEGIQAIGAGRTAIFINFVPVSAVLSGYLLLGETIDASLILGTLLVILGATLVNRKKRA